MSLSTHVLDAVRGRPAAGVQVEVQQQDGDAWRRRATGATDADGRVAGLMASADMAAGVYRIVFAVERYFAATGIEGSFYPEVVVVFRVVDPAEHHHVPLLLSPFAYSTYRGS